MKAFLYLMGKYDSLTVTLKQSCEELGLAMGTAYNQISAGTFPLPTRKVGKHFIIDVRDLGDHLDELREEARKAFNGE
jgi:predicted site-specific integrase-resolvase